MSLLLHVDISRRWMPLQLKLDIDDVLTTLEQEKRIPMLLPSAERVDICQLPTIMTTANTSSPTSSNGGNSNHRKSSCLQCNNIQSQQACIDTRNSMSISSKMRAQGVPPVKREEEAMKNNKKTKNKPYQIVDYFKGISQRKKRRQYVSTIDSQGGKRKIYSYN